MTIDENFLRLRKIVRLHGKYVMRKLFDNYLTGPINKKVIPSCILCGSEKDLTREHVLPKWVFESNDKYFFTTDVNQLHQSYIRATVPACRSCNSDLLNAIERYIQKTLSEVDLKRRYYSPEEWKNVIRWLEIIDFKFQVWDIMTKFRTHKTAGYIPFLAEFSIAFMRDMSVRSVTSESRLALKRIGTKNKDKRTNSLIVGRTIEKTFHYFHTSGQFKHLELPSYNKAFFYFLKRNTRATKLPCEKRRKLSNQFIKHNYKPNKRIQ